MIVGLRVCVCVLWKFVRTLCILQHIWMRSDTHNRRHWNVHRWKTNAHRSPHRSADSAHTSRLPSPSTPSTPPPPFNRFYFWKILLLVRSFFFSFVFSTALFPSRKTIKYNLSSNHFILYAQAHSLRPFVIRHDSSIYSYVYVYECIQQCTVTVRYTIHRMHQDMLS